VCSQVHVHSKCTADASHPPGPATGPHQAAWWGARARARPSGAAARCWSAARRARRCPPPARASTPGTPRVMPCAGTKQACGVHALSVRVRVCAHVCVCLISTSVGGYVGRCTRPLAAHAAGRALDKGIHCISLPI